MADIKVKRGDRVVVYRNMPHLDHYLCSVDKGFEGVVSTVGGCDTLPWGRWARVRNGEEYRYVKLTYLKHA